LKGRAFPFQYCKVLLQQRVKRKRRSKAGAFYFLFLMQESGIKIPGRSFRRAAVIVPPLRDFYFTRHRFSSLGAQIAATLLRREGMQVDLFNFPLMKQEGSIVDIPSVLNHISPYIIPEETGRVSFFTHFRRFGPPVDRCAEMIQSKNPGICFLSIFAFCYADDALECARRIRAKLPSVIIAAGGAGVSAYPAYCLKNGDIDFALCGEAEACLPEFLRELFLPAPDFAKVPNLSWKTGGVVRVSPLRTHAKAHEIEVALVKTAESARSVTLSTSLMRGCPKQCDFCSSVLLFGSKIRTPPLDRLDALLSSLPEEISEDDNLLCDCGFLRASTSLFKKHLPRASFIAENGLDYSLLTPERCAWLAAHGMGRFNLSLASAVPTVLAGEKRFSFPERYEKAIDFCARNGIPSVTYFICGLKGDTIETTADNLSYLYDKQTIIGISPFYAVPGLPGFTDLSRFERSSSLLCLGSAAYPWNNALSTNTIITAFRLARFVNLKKSIRRSVAENMLLSVIESRRKLYTLVKGKNGEESIAEVARQCRDLTELFFNRIRQKKSPR
jgi:anaerobic magnesium-protoporphyrin IX monomethyl ester cyclase